MKKNMNECVATEVRKCTETVVATNIGEMTYRRRKRTLVSIAMTVGVNSMTEACRWSAKNSISSAFSVLAAAVSVVDSLYTYVYNGVRVCVHKTAHWLEDSIEYVLKISTSMYARVCASICINESE